MHTKVLTWLSIAASLLVLVFWASAQSFQLELNLVVSAAAVAVLIRAFQARKYRRVAGNALRRPGSLIHSLLALESFASSER